MPERELSLEEFDSLFEEAPSTSEAKSPTQKALATAAETKIGLPDIGAALGRPDLFGDLFRAATFPISEPINLMLGNKSFAEKLTSEQQTPSFQSLKGGDIGKAIPDVLQGALVGAGQAGGAALGGLATLPGGSTGAVPGAIAGGAAMSVPATKAASALREYSPEFFGENQNVNIAGIELSPEEFNLAMDAVIPMTAGVGKAIARNFKTKAAEAMVSVAGRKAPEEIAQAYTDIVNPAKVTDSPLEVGEEYIPEFSSGSFGGSLEPVEQVAAVRPRIERQIANAEKTKRFLIDEVGLTPEELKDYEPKRANLELANQLPQRKRAKAFEFAPGEKISPSTARGIDMLAGANRNYSHLRATAKARYNYVQDQLALQGNTDITLDAGTKTALTELHKNLSQLIEDAPDLASAYGKPKRTIEELLGLPQVTKSINKKGDTVITLEKTIETPKNIKRTTGTTITKATDEGKIKTKEFDTSIEAKPKEGEIRYEKPFSSLVSEEKTTFLPEDLAISEGVNFNALVELNSQLKRGVNRGKLVQSEDLPVISTINHLERAIVKDLRGRPNGEMLARKYNEGSKATALRYRLFKPPVEKLLKGEPEQAWNAIAKSEAASNSFLKATGNSDVAKKEIAFRIMDQATEIHNGLEVFSPNKALKIWRDSPGFRTRFTANHRNKIEQFLKVAAASTPDISDIGKFAVAMRSGNLVVNVGQSFLSDKPLSSIPRALAGASLWFGGRMGMGKVLMDPNAAVIATRLLKTPAKSPRANGDLRRLMAYLNGTKVTVNVGNQSFETTVDSDLLSRVKFANEQQPNQTYDLLNRVQGVQ